MSTGGSKLPGRDDDARLARALDAIRRTPAPEGPSPEALARALAAVESAASSPPSLEPLPRRRTMLTILKIAAALLVAAGGVFFASGPFLVGAPVSFAEVAQKIQQAHSLTYVMTAEIPGQPKAPSVKLFFKEPGRMRVEAVPPGGLVVIADSREAKRLILNPADKTALLLEGRLPGEPKPGAEDLAASTVAGLKKLAEQKGEALGEKVIGGVKAQGFRVVQAPGYGTVVGFFGAKPQDTRVVPPPELVTVVWADPQTKLPVQIDLSGPFGDRTFHSTMHDIQLDPELDDALFRLETPAGYKLQKQDLAGNVEGDDGTPEGAIVWVLRMYAENSDGAFPKRIDDWLAYGQALERSKKVERSQAAAIRMANLFARAQVFLLDRQGDYHYTPDGVQLGDAAKPLFWYQPKDKPNARVLYGDLHAADVPPDQLPAAGKPQPKR